MLTLDDWGPMVPRTKQALIYEWDKVVRLERRGHRVFHEKTLNRWAFADNSGRTPEVTEDGVLWLVERQLLTIVQDARPGLLADITALLARHGVDVEDIDGQAVAGTAIISFRADPYQRSFELLVDAGFTVVAHEHLLVRLPDRPGALAQLSATLSEADLAIRGIHIVTKQKENSIVALETVDHERARSLLSDILV